MTLRDHAVRKAPDGEPWDVSRDDALEFVPLFPSGAEVSLSELDIRPVDAPLFLFGAVFARLHKDGIIAGDLTKENIIFSVEDGSIVIIDPGSLTQAELHPANMAHQFVELLGSYGVPGFTAILGGYAREAYREIDPMFPGFTASLLEIVIGAPPRSSAQPRPSAVNPGRVVSVCGGSLIVDDDSSRVELVRTRDDVPLTASECLLSVTALTVCGVDCRQFLSRCAAASSDEVESSIAEAIGRIDSKTPIASIVESWTGKPAEKAALKFLEKCYGHSAEADSQDSMTAIGVLPIFKAVYNAMAPLDRAELIDLVTDGIDTIAALVDARGEHVHSISLAQLSRIYVQRLIDAEEGLESRLSTMEKRHRELSWADASRLDLLQKETFFVHAGYVNSMCLTRTKLFQASWARVQEGRATNALWSAIWAAIHDMRGLLRACHRYVYETRECADGKTLEQCHFLVRQTTHAYLGILKLHVEASLAHAKSGGFLWAICWMRDPESGDAGEPFLLRRDLECGMKLYQALTREGLLSPTARQSFDEMIAR